MKDNDTIFSLEWRGNSKKMYEAIIEAIPKLFAGSVNKSIVNWIQKNGITVVTEDTVAEAVKSIAPESVAGMILPKLDELRSKK